MSTRSAYRSFLIYLVILTLAIIISLVLINFIKSDWAYPDSLAAIISYFFFFTALIHLVMIKASQDKSQASITYLLAAILFKFVISIGVVTLLIFLNQDQVISTVVIFFCFYIIYTVFEVLFMARYIKENLSSGGGK